MVHMVLKIQEYCFSFALVRGVYFTPPDYTKLLTLRGALNHPRPAILFNKISVTSVLGGLRTVFLLAKHRVIFLIPAKKTTKTICLVPLLKLPYIYQHP